MIRLSGVRKSYTTNKVVNEVLKGVDLDIDAGDSVAIVGRSGSGKTTLLNVLGALDSEYEGSVEVDGKQLSTLDDVAISSYRNQNIGFIFQSFYLLEHMSCIENVALPASFARGDEVLSREAALARARAVMDQVGLSDKYDAVPNTLSGGQKQRVAIARALFNEPQLMICDEPTGNLDLTTAKSILALFRELNEDQGITLIVVTHDLMISEACKRIVHLHDGLIVDGPGEFVSDDDPEVDPTSDDNTDSDPSADDKAAASGDSSSDDANPDEERSA